MQVSREEILHIANLAQLELKEEEIDKYISIGANEAKNIFRKDEVKTFDNIEGLLQNAPAQDKHMFKIPKVLE